ncbi:glycosyltransferase [Phaeobacter italicus]|uniref:glycosyltransferase n=1 Tax=Phaeobacter italicus TaxID=481446 RepID=UPI001C93BB79|nr:glycosyltransferase [Phaeobacter italicus]MBY6043598.1 glycosyltransferase [Phaeobacter italicus]
MKIAYILNTYPQPSHSFIRREVQALERHGVEIERIAMRPADVPLVDPGDIDEQGRTDYVLAKGGARLVTGLVRRMWRSPRRFRSALAKALEMGGRSQVGRLRHLIYLAEAAYVADRVEGEGIDHLHAHFGTNSTTVALLAAMLADVPGGLGYSFTTHGPEEFDAPQVLSLGAKVDTADFAVAISSFGRSQLSRWAAFGSWARLKVVHCGIEPSRFSEPQPLPEGPLRLAAIGRFVEQKGQMVLIHALAKLVETHPDLHLSLIGDGEMRQDLEAAIARYGLSRHVTLTGWLSEADVRAELAKAHALVMPSFAEGLPMVVMEAMAAARPVVATYIAGTPELVVPGQTGWLVPAGDPDVLAEAISDLAATPAETLSRMGQAGRTRVLQRHDSEIEAGKLAHHFEEAIRARRP